MSYQFFKEQINQRKKISKWNKFVKKNIKFARGAEFSEFVHDFFCSKLYLNATIPTYSLDFPINQLFAPIISSTLTFPLIF